jgi:DNA-binding response OmpR family regulator
MPLATKNASLRIAVVDDDRDTAAMLAWLLQMDGHEVIGCYAGKKVIEDACAGRPDVILVDLAMPQQSGLEIARRIRERGEQIALIAVTGHADESQRRLALEAGFDAYLANPVEFSSLSELVRGLPCNTRT